jgi:D-aminopeptidase
LSREFELSTQCDAARRQFLQQAADAVEQGDALRLLRHQPAKMHGHSRHLPYWQADMAHQLPRIEATQRIQVFIAQTAKAVGIGQRAQAGPEKREGIGQRAIEIEHHQLVSQGQPLSR